MNSKKVFGLALSSALLLVACREPAVNPDPNHTHADLSIVVLGTKLDFSGEEYMSPAPKPVTSLFIEKAYAHNGVDHAVEEGKAAELHNYLHLHDGNGLVIHRHKPGLTLGEFLDSIGQHMTATCLTIDDHQYNSLPVELRETYGLTPKLCDTGKHKWQMYVNEEEVAFDPTYAFADLDRILLTYDAADSAPDFEDLVSDDACLYSRTCPERGEPPTENCIADPAIPCVIPEE